MIYKHRINVFPLGQSDYNIYLFQKIANMHLFLILLAEIFHAFFKENIISNLAT